MYNIKRKIITDAMAVLMEVQPMTAFTATELTNSTASSFTEDVNGYDTVGEDVTQEQVAESKEITDITDSTYAAEEEAEVYATRNSKFSVIIPKIITLDGQTKQGNYQVAVKGDLSGNQEVSITPDEQVTLYEQNASVDTKDSVVADISQSKVTWNQSEIDREEYKDSGVTTGVVSAGGITAGSWAGKFNFNIELENGAEEEAEVDENIIRMNYTGPNFNTGIKQLVNESATYETKDTTITGIKTTDVQPSKGTKIIYFMATEADTEPYLKAYLDETTVKLYTKADTVMLSEDSSYMFSNLRGLTGTFDLRTFDASNVTDMSYMFNWCGKQSMTTLDLGDKFDTSNVTNMSYMFSACGHTKMTSLDLGDKFDTSNVRDMSYMFSSCGYTEMTSLDLGDKFDTSNVTNMSHMFYACGYTKMTSLDLGDKFNTSNVTDMSSMFSECGFNAMTTLNLGNKFDITQVSYATYTFQNCGRMKMTSLDLGPKFIPTSKINEGTSAKLFAGTGTGRCVITAPQVAADYFNAMSYKNQRTLIAKSYE